MTILVVPALKLTSKIEASENEEVVQEEVIEPEQLQQQEEGAGRVYVYYGTSQHRPYQGRRYYSHRKGYPNKPYYYRYYYYPYQRSARYYQRFW
ncbi:MAG: hypothetical protein S4CHLAM81_03560 [Chlamydiales bacterium]|nr:hypothetical protein [Chlamydiales bacterium]MCH9635146.1 hypothetical protein [Chlamydiales bacterium]